jgi:Serine dehydrogenase proteinase
MLAELEKLRSSKVICYLTSLRGNLPSQMSEDAVRHFFDHLLLMDTRPLPKIDIFLVSNGGSGTVPWRLISLLREFASKVGVIVPYRAYSAASLLALGADEILMHPFAELGPIDPTVSNEFNPADPNTHQRLGINVEDVSAYVHFLRESVGITHEDELVKVIEILANKVHPLALGNVERFIAQSRMIARKLLKTHMAAGQDHVIDEIVENMASKLYFHGHPINRQEAKSDLGLKVVSDLSPHLESLIWNLYLDFENEFQNQTVFFPPGDLARLDLANPGTAAAAPPGFVPISAPVEVDYPELLQVMVESRRLSCRYTTDRRYRMTKIPTPQGIQSMVQEDILSQGWNCSSASAAAAAAQSESKSLEGAPTG